MPRAPGIAWRLLPYRRVTKARSTVVSKRSNEPKSAFDLSVEFGLILLRSHAVLRQPWRPRIAVPDAGEAFAVAVVIRRDAAKAKSLARMIVKELLVLGSGQPVPSDPGQPRFLLPDRAEARHAT